MPHKTCHSPLQHWNSFFVCKFHFKNMKTTTVSLWHLSQLNSKASNRHNMNSSRVCATDSNILHVKHTKWSLWLSENCSKQQQDLTLFTPVFFTTLSHGKNIFTMFLLLPILSHPSPIIQTHLAIISLLIMKLKVHSLLQPYLIASQFNQILQHEANPWRQFLVGRVQLNAWKVLVYPGLQKDI